jgi:hypothetical protein
MGAPGPAVRWLVPKLLKPFVQQVMYGGERNFYIEIGLM